MPKQDRRAAAKKKMENLITVTYFALCGIAILIGSIKIIIDKCKN